LSLILAQWQTRPQASAARTQSSLRDEEGVYIIFRALMVLRNKCNKVIQRRGRPVCLPRSGGSTEPGQTHRSAPTLLHYFSKTINAGLYSSCSEVAFRACALSAHAECQEKAVEYSR